MIRSTYAIPPELINRILFILVRRHSAALLPPHQPRPRGCTSADPTGSTRTRRDEPWKDDGRQDQEFDKKHLLPARPVDQKDHHS